MPCEWRGFLVDCLSKLRAWGAQKIVAWPSAYTQVSSTVSPSDCNDLQCFSLTGSFPGGSSIGGCLTHPYFQYSNTPCGSHTLLWPPRVCMQCIDLLLHHLQAVGHHRYACIYLCILGFGSWLHLLDRSQYSVSTYITYKVPDFHTNWILACQQNLVVNLSKCYVPVCIVLQEGHLANVSGHLVCKLYGQHNPIKVLQHQLLVVQKCTDICEVSNKLESKQLLQR